MVHLLEFIANLGVPQGSVLGPIQLSFIMGFCEWVPSQIISCCVSEGVYAEWVCVWHMQSWEGCM